MASEYLRWKYRDVQPEEKPQYTRREKALNWWHYHKGWLLLGVILLAAGVDLLLNMLGIGKTLPDYQLAYAASVPLSDQAAAGLESALASLGQDCNGDGKVVVQVNTYVDMRRSQDSDAAQYAAAAQVRLMADLESCESYFFLCADPEELQLNYQVLARADGGLAEAGDAVFALPWEAVAAGRESLSALTELNGLYLARRGFWQDRTCQNREQCDALWRALTEGVIP